MMNGMMKMSRIVGVKIDTKSTKTKEKVYYYKTNNKYKRGEIINIRVESGGTPSATVVVGNSKKKIRKRLKDLEEV